MYILKIPAVFKLEVCIPCPAWPDMSYNKTYAHRNLPGKNNGKKDGVRCWMARGKFLI